MKKSAQVVVVGGGVVGVSTLYHLAKKGWIDVVLVERKELTSGSTWHAAGLLPLFNMSYSVGKLHQYSVDFYHELQEETGLVGEIKMWNKTYYPKGWVAHVEVEKTSTNAWVVDDSKVAEVRWWNEVPPLMEWTVEEFEDLSEWHCQRS